MFIVCRLKFEVFLSRHMPIFRGYAEPTLCSFRLRLTSMAWTMRRHSSSGVLTMGLSWDVVALHGGASCCSWCIASSLVGFAGLLQVYLSSCRARFLWLASELGSRFIESLTFLFFLSPPPQVVVFSSTRCIDLEWDACRSILSRDELTRGPTSTTNDNNLLVIYFFVLSKKILVRLPF